MQQIYILLIILVWTIPAWAEESHQHDVQNSHDEHEEEAVVKLSKAQRINIRTILLKPRRLANEIQAPGEVILNTYASVKITPRIKAQVIERHVKMGDKVKKGQVLVTLSSVAMSEAQGELLVTANEWERLRKLGKQIVSERRYTEARIAYQQAHAKVLAYGLTSKKAKELIKKGNILLANGQFNLFSTISGKVINDDFILGEIIEPGRVLFDITNESTVWVEARITPKQAGYIKVGSKAQVQVNSKWINCKVIQLYHQVDERTRTLAVRIAVPNRHHNLHPGIFVKIKLQTNQREKVLAVPEEAILRSPDGDWQVFIETAVGEYKPQEVTVLRTINQLSVIEGLESGSKVVTQGTFFLQSEIAKSGFDIHNH
ncbi:MAG TPA: efflux RND transporter periplasmic adaptor subunit [Thioploca sp.]|nr:efflux RND transporter periplasmic adaptor subunit [Thioploca sp.]